MTTPRSSPSAADAMTLPYTVRHLEPSDAAGADRAIRRLVDNAASHGVSLRHLYGAYDGGGRLVAAALLVVQAGATGLVFVAPPRRPHRSALSLAVQACTEAARAERLKLIQAMLSPEDRWERMAIEQAGFGELATLAYMQMRVPDQFAQPPEPPGVQLLNWTPDREDQFRIALEASYHQTLDCPGLRGLRDTRESLEGHRAVGQFDPQLWTLVRIKGAAAGVMLLNRVPAAGTVELVYLGLAPKFRGRGLGRMLVQRAMWLCAQREERCLTLAVDTHNAPAVALYRHFGFCRTATRVVLIRPLHAPLTSTP